MQLAGNICMSKYITRRMVKKKYIISNLYRKPGEVIDEFNVFLEEFTSFLIYINNQNRPSYLCGDYNIDLLKVKTKNHLNDYFDELVTNGFLSKNYFAYKNRG